MFKSLNVQDPDLVLMLQPTLASTWVLLDLKKEELEMT